MNREEAILLLHDMKDTYDEIHENTNGDLGYEQMTALDMAIEALKADAVQDWIPIATEPNTADHVLVTYKWDDDDYEVSELDYWVTEYEAEKGNEKCKWLIDHVTAWMPLPKPYKGGDGK